MEIKSVRGSRRTIRRALDELVMRQKPVFDVTYTRVGLFDYVAIIHTGKPYFRAI